MPLGAGVEGDDRGRDGWMVSPTRWTWIWVISGSWWWTGRPGMLQFMGSQRVRHDWATELNWTECSISLEMATHSSIRAGKFHGQRSLAGYNLCCHRVGHDWVCVHTQCSIYTFRSLNLRIQVTSSKFLHKKKLLQAPLVHSHLSYYLSHTVQGNSLLSRAVY